jgi:hypothetical protein
MQPGILDRRNTICPYFKKQCKKVWEDCAFSIEKTREYNDGRQVVVKACAIWFQADEMENHSLRLAMVQKEMGQTKNAAVFQSMALLADSAKAKHELQKVIGKNVDGINHLLSHEKHSE